MRKGKKKREKISTHIMPFPFVNPNITDDEYEDFSCIQLRTYYY